MAVKDFIRENLPESWLKAATELRMKTELINRLYGHVPRNYKNKNNYRQGIHYLRGVFLIHPNKLIYYVEATDIDLKKWERLVERINEINYQCEQYHGGFGLKPNKKKKNSNNCYITVRVSLMQQIVSQLSIQN